MTDRQKKALRNLADDLCGLPLVQIADTGNEHQLQVVRQLCQAFVEETRFIRSEAGPEYDV